MSDRHHCDLRGPVRTVEIQLGDRHSIVDFRPDGSLIRQWNQSA